MRYLITFSYDGTKYSGYQKQPNLKTIQGEIETSLKKINGGKEVTIHSSGRTDKGVHAINQKAHFDFDKDINCYKLRCAINRYIDDDIYIKSVQKVSDNFHARYMVKKKTYVYKINIGIYNPIERNYVFQYNRPLDLNKLLEQANYLVGTHDFSAFVNKEDGIKDFVRTIYSVSVCKEDDIITITFVGNGFIKYQIRNMVGALIECNNKNKNIKQILESKKRESYGKIAPSCGLYLYDVEY